MTAWLDWLRDARAPAAMVTVLASEGSAPRGPGTRMLVAGTLHGTIGGGRLEFAAVEQARALLDLPPGSWRIQDYPLGPLLGQCCGGRVRLLLEHVDPARLDWIAGAAAARAVESTLTPARVDRRAGGGVPTRLSARGNRPVAGARFVEAVGQYRRPLYLFGAGHVGQAVARHAATLPFDLAWFDTRGEFGAIDGVVVESDDRATDCIADAPGDAAIVVMTHDHGLDYRLTHAALTRRPTAFVGLIGSTTKRARFLAHLERDGVDAAARARLTSPIGVGGIVGKEPDVIAVATLAQLLQLPEPA